MPLLKVRGSRWPPPRTLETFDRFSWAFFQWRVVTIETLTQTDSTKDYLLTLFGSNIVASKLRKNGDWIFYGWHLTKFNSYNFENILY